MTSYALNWLETSPAIEIRVSWESPPVARYMLSTSTRDGDAPLFHQSYQRDLAALDLPAALLPQIDMEGNDVSGISGEFADAEYVETSKLVLPAQQYEELFGPDTERSPEVRAVWVQGIDRRQAADVHRRFDLQPGLFIDTDQSVTILGREEHPPRYLVSLPRVVLRDDYYIADNTEELLSMGTLLEDFVQRFSSADRAVKQVRVATGYLYGSGMRQVLGLLENPRIHNLQLLFSGHTDRSTARAMTAMFADNFDEAMGDAQDAEFWQMCHEALKAGRLKLKVYTRAFLHAKLFMGWDYINNLGHVEGGRAVVGSSNVTGSGLGSQGNLELNVTVDSPERVTRLVDWFEARWEEAASPEPPLLEVLEHRRPAGVQPTGEDEPLFRTPGLFEIWEQGHQQRLATTQHYLSLLVDLYDERLDSVTVLDGPAYPEVDRRRIEPSAEQVEGVYGLAQRLVDTRFAFLADSVGLGKTITALGAASFLQRSGRVRGSALVAPRKLFAQWRDDAEAVGISPDVFDFVNRHRLERREPEEAIQRLDGVDLIVVEEAHQSLRNRRNHLWENLRAYLAQNHRAMVLLVSATPWNNSREDIYNYLRLAWADGRLLDDDYRALATAPLSRHLPLFYSLNPTTGARSFAELSVEQYRDVFHAVFIQRTRYALEAAGRDAPNFPRRQVHPSRTTPSAAHDQFYATLESELAELNLPHYQPFDALQRSALALGSLPADEAPTPSNLHRAYIIQLYKRAESSLFALAVSLRNLHGKLNLFRDTFTEIRDASNPVEQLADWLRDNYLRLEDEELLEEDEEFTLMPEEWMSPAEKVRWANMQSFLGRLDADDARQIIDYLISVEVEPEIARVNSLSRRLTLELERSDPKASMLFDIVEGHVERGDKLLAVGGYADTALRFFVSAIGRFPELRVALALGGGEAWVYDPAEHDNPELKRDEWRRALDRPSKQRRTQLLGAANRAGRVERADALAAFCPTARGADDELLERMGGEIDLLVGSEAVSVGQNLQDATALVQLDLPWNPMVIEQRIGRIDRREGGRPPRGDEPGDRPVVDVHYCWSPAAVEKEVALRRRLRTKAKGAIEDTNFDELLLFELKEHIEQVKSERGEEALTQSSLAEFLQRRQRELAERASRIPDIEELAGSDVDGLRRLATLRDGLDAELDEREPSFGCVTDHDAPFRWFVTVELQPRNADGDPLGATPLLAHLPIRDDDERLVSNLGIVVDHLEDAGDAGAVPSCWREELTGLDGQLQKWRRSLLDEHNRKLRQNIARRERGESRPSPGEKLREQAFRAYQRLHEEAVMVATQDESKLEEIEDRLFFLIKTALQPENLFELLADTTMKELEAALVYCAQQPTKVLLEDFDTVFDQICGEFYARREAETTEELGDEASQAELDLAGLDGPWDDLDIRVLALTYLETNDD